MLVGVALTSYFSSERSVLLQAGDSVELGGYEFCSRAARESPDRITMPTALRFSSRATATPWRTCIPELRVYLASGTPSTEMAIDPSLLRDLFVTPGEIRDNGAWTMTVYVKPFVRWIWLGAIFMALGATIAAADRRYRKLARKQTEEPADGELGQRGLQPASGGGT